MIPVEFVVGIVLAIGLAFVIWRNVCRGYREEMANPRPERPPSSPREKKRTFRDVEHPVFGTIRSNGNCWWAHVESDVLGYLVSVGGDGAEPYEEQMEFWRGIETRIPEILRTAPPFEVEHCSSYGNSPTDFDTANATVSEVRLFDEGEGESSTLFLNETYETEKFLKSPCIEIDRDFRPTDSYWCA